MAAKGIVHVRRRVLHIIIEKVVGIFDAIIQKSGMLCGIFLCSFSVSLGTFMAGCAGKDHSDRLGRRQRPKRVQSEERARGFDRCTHPR